MKRRHRILAPLFLFFGLIQLNAATDISGTWVLDRSRSDLGPAMNDLSVAMKETVTVTLDGNHFVAKRSQMIGTGTRLDSSEDYIVDGKLHSSPLPEQKKGLPASSSYTAAWDGEQKCLSVVKDVVRQSAKGTSTFHNVFEWRLDDSKKVLTITGKTTGAPRGDISTKSVYTRPAASETR